VVKNSFQRIFLHALTLSLIVFPFPFVDSPILVKVPPLSFLPSLYQLSLIPLSLEVNVKSVPMIGVMFPVTKVNISLFTLENSDSMSNTLINHLTIIFRIILKFNSL
jgi:hypothetical protein